MIRASNYLANSIFSLAKCLMIYYCEQTQKLAKLTVYAVSNFQVAKFKVLHEFYNKMKTNKNEVVSSICVFSFFSPFSRQMILFRHCFQIMSKCSKAKISETIAINVGYTRRLIKHFHSLIESKRNETKRRKTLL